MFANAKQVFGPFKETYWITSVGLVTMKSKYEAEFITTFNWLRYPFDQQWLAIDLRIYALRGSNAVLGFATSKERNATEKAAQGFRMQGQPVIFEHGVDSAQTPLFALCRHAPYRTSIVSENFTKPGHKHNDEFVPAETVIVRFLHNASSLSLPPLCSPLLNEL